MASHSNPQVEPKKAYSNANMKRVMRKNRGGMY